MQRDDNARASASRSTTPYASTGSSRTSAPSSAAARADSRTAGCSTADTSTTASPVERNAASTTPSTARLADSVPPEVKTISPASRPKNAGHLVPRVLQQGPGPLRRRVAAGRVAERTLVDRRHRRRHLGTQRAAVAARSIYAGQAIHTVLGLVNSFNPSSDSSRP